MILLLLASMVICLLAWVYMRWVIVRSYWARRGVPHLPPHPFYGNLTFLQKINPAIWMRQIYDQFQAPYVGIWLFWRPALVVNCPEIGRNILVKDSANFRNRFLSSDSHDLIGSLNLFTVNDPLWSNMRRRITAVFTSSKLKAIQQLMNVKSKELVQRIEMESKKGRFNYRVVFNDYTSDVIGTASFGVESNATLTGYSPIRAITKDFERYSLLRGISWCCVFFFPELVKPFRFRVFPKATTDFFRKIYSMVEKQREKEFNIHADPHDLLDVLLKMKKDMKAENKDIPDDICISQAAAFLQAGFDTSGSQITFLTYELAHHPEIQERLFKELKEAEDENGDANFDETTLANMMYLNCVIKESIRKYQPMGWLDRVSSNDYKIDDKLTIPAGTPIYVNAIGMHYDPDYFAEPNRFNPDRFLPENEINIKKFTFMPFGEGPRKCIGWASQIFGEDGQNKARTEGVAILLIFASTVLYTAVYSCIRFAYATVRTALAAIVINYELKPVPNTPKPNELQIEKNGMFLAPGEKMYVEFVPRC